MTNIPNSKKEDNFLDDQNKYILDADVEKVHDPKNIHGNEKYRI